MTEAQDEIELRLLLEAILARYQHDFLGYTVASMLRRARRAAARLGCATLSDLRERILRDPAAFAAALDELTIQVTDLFRDPGHFRAVRERVAPVLATYPSIRVWVAGCATGEEVWSYAILLREEGLLDRALIYATDVHAPSLEVAERAVYPAERMAAFGDNYLRAGGRGSLADHYSAAYGAAVFDRALRARVVFADHSLATDAVFAEVQLVSCRNVLIYFDRALQDRALGLFADALCPMGFLGLGPRETVRFSAHAARFGAFAPDERIWRRA